MNAFFASQNEVNLESLIEPGELDKLKQIRSLAIPKQVGKLGEGASAEVFLFQLTNGSYQAGKKPRISLFNKSKNEIKNIKKHLNYAIGEIQTLHRLDHEKIVKLFGFYLDQSQIIIFMEAMHSSVRDEIKDKCLTEFEAISYFTQAAEGLAYLHSRRPKAIVHRDIKCENLLLTAEKRVKLADFGLAIDLAVSSGSITLDFAAPTSLAGTYFFIAPEVIRNMENPEAYGRKSDVWSLACTLIQMMSGQPPYSELNFLQFWERSLTTSKNRLIFSGELLPSASTTIKLLLNCLFIVDCEKRPNVFEVLAAAEGIRAGNLGPLYQLQEMVKYFVVLENDLSPSNCLGIRDIADAHSCERLHHAAEKIVFGKFEEVANSKEFLLLPVTQLIDLIASDDLNAQEENVYNAVMGWIRHELDERRPFLAEVLQHVSLPLCKPEFVTETVSKDDLVKRDHECRDLVDEAKDYLLLPPEKRSLMNGKRMQRRMATRSAILFAVGGVSNSGTESSVEQMNVETGEWRLVAPMSTKRIGAGVAVLNDQVFAFGGSSEFENSRVTTFVNSMERYDPLTNQWNSARPMLTARCSFGAIEFDGIIYAIGGFDFSNGTHTDLNVVEKYDPICDRWMSIAPMFTRRYGLSIAVMNGCLYAIGGYNGNYLDTIERLDPRENKWTAMTPMAIKKYACGSAVINGCIYVAGGSIGPDSQQILSSMECFDPRTEQWSNVAAMNSRRTTLGLTVFNEQLVAVGGSDGSNHLNTVEIYEPKSNCWRFSGELNIGRDHLSLGVVYDASRK